MQCVGDTVFWFAFYAVAASLAWSLYAAWRDGLLLTIPIVAWGMPFALLYYPLVTADVRGLTGDVSFPLLLLSGAAGTAIGLLLCRDAHATNRDAAAPKVVIPAPLVYVGAGLYLAFISGSMVERIQANGGLLAALTVARLEEFLGGAILEGRSLEVLFIFPQILYYVLIGRLLAGRRWVLAIGLVAALSAYYVFTANTRLPIVFPWVALAVVAVEQMPVRRFRAVAPVAAAAVVTAVAFVVVVGSALRLGTLENLSSFSGEYREVLRSQTSADLGYPDWVKDVQRAVDMGQVPLDHGYGWVVLGSISLVPRVLWSEKPLTSASNRLTELVYDVKIGDGTPITTFTVYGDGYFQGMYLGVVLSAVLFVCGYAFLTAWMRRYRHTEFWVAMVLLHMVTFFRGELPVPDFLVWTGALVLFAIASDRVRRTAAAQLPT